MLIKDFFAEHNDGMYRVSADAGGAPLWFESSDIDLQPAPEAFASALLIPALMNGNVLVIDAAVSQQWLANVKRLLDIFNEWWGYPKLMPEVGSVRHAQADVQGTALCFSGGVDSFFSLLRSNYKIDLLVTVQGFDIPLTDYTRMTALRSSLKCVIAGTALKSVIIRTNIREHPEFAKAPWTQTHGAALAAIAHTLIGHVNRTLISSSYAYVNLVPWGSHPKTDPLWSSDKLEIIHFGAEFQRVEKLPAIAEEPLVRQHLRVCWENRAPQGNCSNCENCVRTRLILADCGQLSNFPVFEGEESLVSHIDALPVIKTLPKLYKGIVERHRLRPDIHRAVVRLLKRTERAKSYPWSLARRAIRKVSSWTNLYQQT